MQKIVKKFLTVTKKSLKQKNYRLLIGQKFYDIRDHVRSKSFHRFYLL